MGFERSGSPQLWALVASAAWRRLRGRLRLGPVYRWRFTGRTPERVLIAPPDLRLADPQIANEIYHCRFPFAGTLVDTQGASPFEIETASRQWLCALHGFGWLRHMAAAETDLAAANARALVADWMALHGRRIGGLAWGAGVTARRIIAWLQHSGVVLHGADYAFYRVFLKSLAIQIRYLRTVAPEMPGDEEKLRARIALAFAALSLPAAPAALRAPPAAWLDVLGHSQCLPAVYPYPLGEPWGCLDWPPPVRVSQPPWAGAMQLAPASTGRPSAWRAAPAWRAGAPRTSAARSTRCSHSSETRNRAALWPSTKPPRRS